MTAGYVAQLEAVAEEARKYRRLMSEPFSEQLMRDISGRDLDAALAALVPADGTVTLTAEQAEKVRAALKDREWWEHPQVDPDSWRKHAALRDEALSLLSRGQGEKCPDPDCVLLSGHPGMHEGKDYARVSGVAPSPWLWGQGK